ncbi:hypothetical protein HPB49_003944 [Dermacentor silvarum]|uniref:Uncharacterized protein n=1 Tax=Dermacentor silvarum TaxID=543639 RepID=A0ACB8DU15_DERSI|nr:hypothetical protein HPB49_003944 [Dermacentor silvarum]
MAQPAASNTIQEVTEVIISVSARRKLVDFSLTPAAKDEAKAACATQNFASLLWAPRSLIRATTLGCGSIIHCVRASPHNCSLASLCLRFVQRAFKHVINGQTVELDRERPTLTEDAIPTIFLDAPSYFTKQMPNKRAERNLDNSDTPPRSAELRITTQLKPTGHLRVPAAERAGARKRNPPASTGGICRSIAKYFTSARAFTTLGEPF